VNLLGHLLLIEVGDSTALRLGWISFKLSKKYGLPTQ